jgi:heme-degrading monooxygenase HmoA
MGHPVHRTATISRHWRGLAKAGEAANYIRHLEDETFPQLARLAGFRSATILQRPVASGVEFLIVTTWESIDAIRQFAGEPVEQAAVPDRVRAMMAEYDTTVTHYEIASEFPERRRA